MLAVLDYGGGNLGSLLAALERRGAAHEVVTDPGSLDGATAAILPGDGAFGATMNALRARSLDEAILRHVRAGKPFLGICVGMQVLFQSSDEFGFHEGLGIFEGRVSRFESAPRVPHMGWNLLEIGRVHPLVQSLGDEPYAYFLHSYRAPAGAETLASCTHGEQFCAIAAHGNVIGTQFHPEKSSRTGARLLDNFIALAEEARRACHSRT
jgi:glutamine amidotransferase